MTVLVRHRRPARRQRVLTVFSAPARVRPLDPRRVWRQ